MQVQVKATVSKIIRTALFIVLLLPLSGCGDSIFEAIAFAPARQLEDDVSVCRYFNRITDRDCENTEFEELFFQSLDPEVRLHALFFPNPDTRKLIVYFHGNGAHIYLRLRHSLRLAELANVFIVSYRGYSKSTGEPSEAGVYEDAIATLEYASEELGFATTQTYIFGRSLGGAVAIGALDSLVSDNDYGGLILVSPFYSGLRMAEDKGLGWVPGLNNPFDSASKVRNFSMPLLVIHGTEDSIIPFEHGYDLYRQYPIEDKVFRTVHGVGHHGISRIAGENYWRWIGDLVAR